MDVFRGMTIVGMILVNNPGSWSHIYSPLRHASWHGCTPTDLVFPFFLFITGVSINFSLGRVRSDKGQHRSALLKILKRSALLFIIGLFLNAFPYFDLSVLRIPGVLQRIAIVYLICAILFLKTNWKYQIYTGICLLLGYWAIMALVPFPGENVATFDKGLNIAAWLDNQLLPGHLWRATKTWDPEGFLSTLPAIVTGIMGVLAGSWLKGTKPAEEKVIYMFLVANLSITIALLWGTVFPINKSLWTSSFVLYTGGIALHFLALLYWLLDIKHFKINPLIKFRAFGINPLFLYTLSILVAILLSEIPIHYVDETVSLKYWIYSIINGIVPLPLLSSFIYAILFTLSMYAVAWLLSKKNIIIKV